MKPWEFRGRKTERNAPQGTLCSRSGCAAPRPTPSQAHCTVCHETFGGVTGFDKHRKDGWCQNPASVDLVADDRGIWRWPASPDLRRFAESLRGPEPLPGL